LPRVLINIFLYAFVAGCLSGISVGVYALYEGDTSSETVIGPTIIAMLKNRQLMTAIIFISIAALWTAYLNIILVRQDSPSADLVTIFHIVVCIFLIIASYMEITRLEGRYFLHSNYFELYLYAAIPMGLLTLLGISGIIWKLMSKPVFKNKESEMAGAK
jgi:hypothetical protein